MFCLWNLLWYVVLGANDTKGSKTLNNSKNCWFREVKPFIRTWFRPTSIPGWSETASWSPLLMELSASTCQWFCKAENSVSDCVCWDFFCDLGNSRRFNKLPTKYSCRTDQWKSLSKLKLDMVQPQFAFIKRLQKILADRTGWQVAAWFCSRGLAAHFLTGFIPNWRH